MLFLLAITSAGSISVILPHTEIAQTCTDLLDIWLPDHDDLQLLCKHFGLPFFATAITQNGQPTAISNRPFYTKGSTHMESFVKYLDPIKQPKSSIKNILCYQLYLCWRWIEGRENTLHENETFFLESEDVTSYWSRVRRRRESTPVENDRRVMPRMQEPGAAKDDLFIKAEPDSPQNDLSSPENDTVEDESCGECESPPSRAISVDQVIAKSGQASSPKQDIIAAQSPSPQHLEEHDGRALDATVPAANTRRKHGIVRRKVHF
jgi:hypothetical protein